MGICVYSEIEPLKKVLLHRPGDELEQLVPESLDRLLFDDIPYLRIAQEEHDVFADVLRSNGAQVVYLEDLMAETLAATPNLREEFICDFIKESGPGAQHHKAKLFSLFAKIDSPKELVLKTMRGVSLKELKTTSRGPFVSLVRPDSHFVLDPIPNLYFTRDPFASIGGGATLHRMYSQTRRREVIYARYILNHHPDYAGQVPFYYLPSSPFSIEGGDILVVNKHTLIIGFSQRTSPEAIELLAHNLFADPQSSFTNILVLNIPSLRAYMHLDTVFTQVDADKFTIHPSILPQLEQYLLQKQPEGKFTAQQLNTPLQQTLSSLLQMDAVELILCGGQDFVTSQREQWNDGANTLCLAPGKVAVYNRNTITNRILQEQGVQVIELPSSELSRGRGGPRCMSMPLERAYF